MPTLNSKLKTASLLSSLAGAGAQSPCPCRGEKPSK
ncbi:MAG: hypothetical protein KatS3mg082_2729 [Nitrospiraceae bacterium]|nr:MAG: hypothetical protein KatS3mg082_2729 [Nitrospiraceae bacterium]GIW81332.1 MAG: hypothetical protein KatS3mg105_3139 [Gemmatales bacterium]